MSNKIQRNKTKTKYPIVTKQFCLSSLQVKIHCCQTRIYTGTLTNDRSDYFPARIQISKLTNLLLQIGIRMRSPCLVYL
ncbi:hypothetical protein DPMN_077895 [Dreissena polymorpha]|uniref:Uncharacterized protein n=1 Tax=Dreissena polymorpha TaxID=45954 RepID=A0A9D3YRH2_DREPO|nr:hypothetical protein DPMN_077895 [Dreissena polymorpha]